MRLLWLGLAACASMLLLAVTTHLTQDVAAIPFLWIVPLTVYLLSFISASNRRASTAARCFVPLLMPRWLHGLSSLAGHHQRAMAMRLARSDSVDAWLRCSSAAWCATANWRGSSRIRAT